MKTTEQYRADLFDTASQFETDDATKLAKIGRLITRAVSLYSSLGYTGTVFDEIIVYAVAADLRDDELSKANTYGVASVTAGIETRSYFNASSAGGNPFRVRLRELTGKDDEGESNTSQPPRRNFGAYLGGGC